MTRFMTSGLGAAALMLVAATALAQVTGGQVLDRSVPRADDPEEAPLPPRTGLPPTREAPLDAQIRIALSKIEIRGATLFPAEVLRAQIADRIGTAVGAAELAEMARRIQAFYREAGFLFTRAVVTAVDAEDGRVTITVVEARIDGVAIEEPGLPVGRVRSLLEALAEPLVGLENPRLADLERALLLMNDIPGIFRATAVPRAGDGGPGSVLLSINVERDPFAGLAFGDSRQQPAFGQGFAGVTLEAGGYGPGGDTTRLTGTTSFWDDLESFTERAILQVEQQRFFGSGGGHVTLRGLYSRSRPGDVLAPLDLAGRGFEFEITGEYPVIRTRPLSFWLRTGAEYKSERLLLGGTNARVTDEETRTLYLEGETLIRDGTGFTRATAGMRQGLEFLGASREGDANLSRFDGDPGATVFYGRLEREQLLISGLSLFGRVEGQVATAPLLASEEFTIGGTTFGRGFDPAEELGDHGLGATVELRYRQPFELLDAGFSAEVYGFGDYGRIWNIEAAGAIPSTEDLVSVGGGLRLDIANRARVATELAVPLRGLGRQGAGDVRLFFNAQYQF